MLSQGWRAIQELFRSSLKEKPEDEDAEGVLPALTEGQVFEPVSASVTEHFTSPPKPYTEDTLLSAMENAGKEDMPDEAERKGLGTPATRAAIIEKLVSGGFVERKGKNLIPTKAGVNLVTVLPELLISPKLTADWEQRFERGGKGPGVAGGLHGRNRGDGGGAGAEILPYFRGWAKAVPAGERDGGPLPPLRQAGL